MNLKITLTSSLTAITLLITPIAIHASETVTEAPYKYKFGDITKCVFKNVIKVGGDVACLLAGQKGPLPIEQAQRFLALAELQENLTTLEDLLKAMNAQTTVLATTGPDIAVIKSQQRTINEQRERIKATERAYWDAMVAEDPAIQQILLGIDAKTQAAAGSKVAKVTTNADKVAAVMSLIPFKIIDKVSNLLEKGIAHGKARQEAALEAELAELKTALEQAQNNLKTHIGDLTKVNVRNASAKEEYGLSMQLLNGYIAKAQEKIVEKTGDILAAQKAVVEAATPQLDATNTEITLKLRAAKCPEITIVGEASSSAIAACQASILAENFPAHGTCAQLSATSTSAEIKACLVGLDG